MARRDGDGAALPSVESKAFPTSGLPCVLLVPLLVFSQGPNSIRGHAKVFPLSKAASLQALLDECSHRFHQQFQRIFTSDGREIFPHNYAQLCMGLKNRSLLLLSCGDDFTTSQQEEKEKEEEGTTGNAKKEECPQNSPETKEVEKDGQEKHDCAESKEKEQETKNLIEKPEKLNESENEEQKAIVENEEKTEAEEHARQERARIFIKKKTSIGRRHANVLESIINNGRLHLSAPRVKTANLSGRAISALPDYISTWKAIEDLNANFNLFSRFPLEIVQGKAFRYLQTLELSHNGIASLPRELCNLEQLTSLNLSSNRLASCFPALLLSSLTKLDLSHNYLTVITPQEVLANISSEKEEARVSAISLTSLSLNNNLLESLPVEMSHLTSLQYLYVKDNPFKPPMHKLNNAGNQAIMLHFLSDLLNCVPNSPKLSRSLSSSDGQISGGLHFISIEDLEIDVSSPLGRGAHGVVWKASYKGTPVAVKNISSIAKFCQEVGILCSMELKHCIKYYGVCVFSDITLVVMEYAPKGDLGKVLKENSSNLTFDDRLRIALKVAKGMKELHRKGILHCDLKTKNILVFETKPWTVKLNDFGLSTQFYGYWDGGRKGSRPRASFKDGHMPSTMYFPCTAPEVLEDGPFTQKSDVYSYGMVLYELFTGLKPFKGIPIDQVTELVLRGNRPSLNEIQLIECEPTTQRDLLPLVKRLIEECWNSKTHARPSFAIIVEKISHMYWKGAKVKKSRKDWITNKQAAHFTDLCKKAAKFPPKNAREFQWNWKGASEGL